jgi:hypothetical protein
MSHLPDVRWRGVGLYAAIVALWCLLAPLLVSAEQFTGKVVSISDGDTLSVLRAGKAVKVRLHGIDTPEKAQAFGTRAQQFTGELAFQKTVTRFFVRKSVDTSTYESPCFAGEGRGLYETQRSDHQYQLAGQASWRPTRTDLWDYPA